MKFSLLKTQYIISVCLGILFLLLVLYKFAFGIYSEIGVDYEGFFIPDLMINYQGGFVRRGLLGEILYQSFLLHPYAIHTFLIFFEFSIFSIFIIISFNVFYKLKCLPIMPIAVIVDQLLAYRRDFLVILISYCVFYSLFNYLKKSNIISLVLVLLLMTVSILLYEPSFFFIVPISMLVFFYNTDKSKNKLRRILGTLITFVLPIATMLIVCISKGTTEQANVIWQSWTPLFDYLNMQQPEIPAAINFLSKSESVYDVSLFHLGLNYGIGIGCILGFSPRLVVGSLLFFVGIYFLSITAPQKLPSKKVTKLHSSIFLFQFFCLLPMFSFLSCDFGRTILYVIFSSYYLVYFVSHNEIYVTMPYFDNISERVISWLQRLSPRFCFILHLAVLIFIPFRMSVGIPVFRSLFLYEYCPVIQQIFTYFD